MKNQINREGAKTAKKEKMIRLNQVDFGVLRDLCVFAVKEVLL
jgi:hypothetical protein